MPYVASLERHERQCPGHWPKASGSHVMDIRIVGYFREYPNIQISRYDSRYDSQAGYLDSRISWRISKYPNIQGMERSI